MQLEFNFEKTRQLEIPFPMTHEEKETFRKQIADELDVLWMSNMNKRDILAKIIQYNATILNLDTF